MWVRMASEILCEERGAETLEWILIGGLLIAVPIALYSGVLQPALTATIAIIGGVINAAV